MQKVLQKLSDTLQTRSALYRSIPFWSWNSSLDERELQRQIAEMKSAGIGGFIMHARTGLKEEYLGEKWFSCVAACLEQARRLHMEAWVYDENGWPSGFAGGRLLENEGFRARFLEYATGAFSPDAFAVFVRSGSGFQRVLAPVNGVSEYHNIFLRVSPSNTDILNAEVTDAFIRETHERYYARFARSFGREFAGFFTDEPQYYRWATPYSPAAEREFAARGEDIRNGLIWLFVRGEGGYAFRQRYYGTLNRLYVQNYYKKLYDWCEAHGCMLTGHSVEESALYAQMWGGGAVMPTYAAEHIPAIDWLGGECGDELAPRQVGSAAAQLGKKFVLTESFGCAGYDVTPDELKSLAEYQFFFGVNRLCQHLYPYSLAGRGKTDHPPVFSPHANWFEGFKVFNDYIARLGCLIGETQEEYELGILHPQRDIWLDYLRSEDYESVKEREQAFAQLLVRLRRRGITYHFIDESILHASGSIEGGALRVGNCVYHTLLLPGMRTLSAKTYRLLRSFTGRLCILGSIEYIDGVKSDISLSSDITLAQIEEGARFPFFCEDGNSVLTARSGEIGAFLFIKNLSRTKESRVRLDGAQREYARLDLQNLTLHALEGDTLVLGGAQSVILMRCTDAAPAPARTAHCRDVTKRFCVKDITENYLLLDRAQIACGNEPFGEVCPVTQLFDGLLRRDYRGELRVRHTFRIREPLALTLIMERAAFKSVMVNGSPVALLPSAADVGFAEAQIGNCLRTGENELVYTIDFFQHDGVHFALFDPMATESLRNCLYYDSSIEPVMLKGDFVADDRFILSRRKGTPPLTERLFAHGYPFFKGSLTLGGNIRYAGRGAALFELCGRFIAGEVRANGRTLPVVFGGKIDISSLLVEGENEVTVVIHSGLRNLLGPHHCADGEPAYVSPRNFEFRGEWGEGRPAGYTDEYRFVPFGIQRILLHTEQK